MSAHQATTMSLTCTECGVQDDTVIPVDMGRNRAYQAPKMEPAPIGSECGCGTSNDCSHCGSDLWIEPDPKCPICNGTDKVAVEGAMKTVTDPIPSAGPTMFQNLCGPCRGPNYDF